MTRLNDRDLYHLREVAKGTKGIRKLMEQRKKELDDNKRSDSFSHPQPRYTPEGMPFFDKKEKTNDQTKSDLEQRNTKTKEKFEKMTQDHLRTEWSKENYDLEIKHLDQVNMTDLLDKGVNSTYQKMNKEAMTKNAQGLDQSMEKALKHQKQFQKERQLENNLEDDLITSFEKNKVDLRYDKELSKEHPDADKTVDQDFSKNYQDINPQDQSKHKDDIDLDYDDI